MSVDDIIARTVAGSCSGSVGTSIAISEAGATASASSAIAAAADGGRAGDDGCVLGYDEAVSRLVAARLAIWDVIGASERAGSLDVDITNPLYNDVRRLVAEVPSIRRICFVTGVGSAKLFRKAWKTWLATPGAFTVASDRASQEVFGKLVQPLTTVPLLPTPTEQQQQVEEEEHEEQAAEVVMEAEQQEQQPSSSSAALTTVPDEPPPPPVPAPPPPPSLPCLPPAALEELKQSPHPTPHPIELVVLESVSPAHIPLVAAKSNAKRVAAYKAEGRQDLLRRPDGQASEGGGGSGSSSSSGGSGDGGRGSGRGGSTRGAVEAPRASAYAWKRAMWCCAAPARTPARTPAHPALFRLPSLSLSPLLAAGVSLLLRVRASQVCLLSV